jgi:hypothetical protein
MNARKILNKLRQIRLSKSAEFEVKLKVRHGK